MARYRVTGSHAVDGHEPGDEYDHDYDDVQERRLVAGGHIAPVHRREKPEPAANLENEKEQ